MAEQAPKEVIFRIHPEMEDEADVHTSDGKAVESMMGLSIDKAKLRAIKEILKL
jgi:hypothetical protein